MRADAGVDAGADTTLANLIGSDKSHDLESTPTSAPESIHSHLSCDLCKPIRFAKFRPRADARAHAQERMHESRFLALAQLINR